MREKFAAIITAFRPDEGFLSRLCPIARFCDVVVIVDNTPGGHAFLGLPEHVVVIQDGCNRGLGNALNRGIQRVGELGVTTAFLFDQDSTPVEADLAALAEGLKRCGGNRTIVGPTHLDDQAATGERPPSVSGMMPIPMACLPTSGLAFQLEALEKDDLFTEAFFLDLVDFEWCFRLKAKGWQVYQLPNVRMLHRLGLGERHLLGISYHIPAPYRHYFQFRDTLKLARLKYVPIRVKLRLVLILPVKVVVYPFIMDHGWQRLKWMMTGVHDAICGVVGIGAAANRLQ